MGLEIIWLHLHNTYVSDDNLFGMSLLVVTSVLEHDSSFSVNVSADGGVYEGNSHASTEAGGISSHGLRIDANAASIVTTARDVAFNTRGLPFLS